MYAKCFIVSIVRERKSVSSLNFICIDMNTPIWMLSHSDLLCWQLFCKFDS